jgi:hypothetical protein
MLQLAVGFEHGVGIDRQFGDDLAHRRQLITRFEQVQAQRLLDLLYELEVGRHP